MYAIAFDLDTEDRHFDVRAVLEEYGIAWRQGSVYFGDERVTPVTCVLAIQELSKRFGWFSTCVRDIRMLRIEENNDLTPAIESA